MISQIEVEQFDLDTLKQITGAIDRVIIRHEGINDFVREFKILWRQTQTEHGKVYAEIDPRNIGMIICNSTHIDPPDDPELRRISNHVEGWEFYFLPKD